MAKLTCLRWGHMLSKAPFDIKLCRWQKNMFSYISSMNCGQKLVCFLTAFGHSYLFQSRGEFNYKLASHKAINYHERFIAFRAVYVEG